MYACSADPSPSDFRSRLHCGPLQWKAINQNKALAEWWKMSWVCRGGAIYRPVGIYHSGWARRRKTANTPGITKLGKIHQEVKARIKVVQGERGCNRQKSSCASSLQLWRVSSWLCVCRAWCWLTDSPVYPEQQSRTLSRRLCNSISASAVTASTSRTSGLDFTFPHLLLPFTQGSRSSAILTHSPCPAAVGSSPWETPDELRQKRKQNGCESLASAARGITWRCSFGVQSSTHPCHWRSTHGLQW